MRIPSKYAGLIVGAILSALPAYQALADSLQLTGAGPTGTVYMYGSALPKGYQTQSQEINVYAGVLDWNDITTGSTVYTYCIDVAAIINVGNTYCFDSPQSLGSAGLPFTTQQINGLYNLWTDPNFGTATGVDGPLTSATAQDAAMFQVAIWDILYNDGSTSLTNSALSFANPGDGLDGQHLQWALDYASADYNNYNPSDPTANPGVMALIATDGSQNQALYIGGSSSSFSMAPLPGSFAAGLVLLFLLGAAGMRRIQTNGSQSERPAAATGT